MFFFFVAVAYSGLELSEGNRCVEELDKKIAEIRSGELLTNDAILDPEDSDCYRKYGDINSKLQEFWDAVNVEPSMAVRKTSIYDAINYIESISSVTAGDPRRLKTNWGSLMCTSQGFPEIEESLKGVQQEKFASEEAARISHFLKILTVASECSECEVALSDLMGSLEDYAGKSDFFEPVEQLEKRGISEKNCKDVILGDIQRIWSLIDDFRTNKPGAFSNALEKTFTFLQKITGVDLEKDCKLKKGCPDLALLPTVSSDDLSDQCSQKLKTTVTQTEYFLLVLQDCKPVDSGDRTAHPSQPADESQGPRGKSERPAPAPPGTGNSFPSGTTRIIPVSRKPKDLPERSKVIVNRLPRDEVAEGSQPKAKVNGKSLNTNAGTGSSYGDRFYSTTPRNMPGSTDPTPPSQSPVPVHSTQLTINKNPSLEHLSHPERQNTLIHDPLKSPNSVTTSGSLPSSNNLLSSAKRTWGYNTPPYSEMSAMGGPALEGDDSARGGSDARRPLKAPSQSKVLELIKQQQRAKGGTAGEKKAEPIAIKVQSSENDSQEFNQQGDNKGRFYGKRKGPTVWDEDTSTFLDESRRGDGVIESSVPKTAGGISVSGGANKNEMSPEKPPQKTSAAQLPFSNLKHIDSFVEGGTNIPQTTAEAPEKMAESTQAVEKERPKEAQGEAVKSEQKLRNDPQEPEQTSNKDAALSAWSMRSFTSDEFKRVTSYTRRSPTSDTVGVLVNRLGKTPRPADPKHSASNRQREPPPSPSFLTQTGRQKTQSSEASVGRSQQQPQTSGKVGETQSPQQVPVQPQNQNPIVSGLSPNPHHSTKSHTPPGSSGFTENQNHHEDPAELTEVIHRMMKMAENVNDYAMRITEIGVTAAHAATLVQVLATLGDLASRCLDQIDGIDGEDSAIEKMIDMTLARMQDYLEIDDEL